MLLQRKDLKGSLLLRPIELPEYLEHILKKLPSVPEGIIGVDLESGLVQVKLDEDKVTSMKFGRFLLKTNNTDADVRECSSLLTSALEQIKGTVLKLTESEGQSEKVYEDGPTSCMAGMECTRVYHSEDVAVAYAEINNRIVARSVVCKNSSLGLRYVRIYGNKDLLLPLLIKNGYELGDLESCKLPRIEDSDGRIMMPFLDCGSRVNDLGTYLEISQYGEFSTDSTSGFLGSWCAGCGEQVSHTEELYFSDHEELNLCSTCFEDNHIYVDGEYYHRDSGNIVATYDGDWILSEEASYSTHDGETYHSDDVVFCEILDSFILESKSVIAVTDIGFTDGEVCLREDCEVVNNIWVHSELAIELNKQMEMEV